MSNTFETYLAQLRAKIIAVVPIKEEKPVNYGYQFKMERNGEKATLTAYNGKGGRKLVWGGVESSLRAELQEAVGGYGIAHTAGTTKREAKAAANFVETYFSPQEVLWHGKWAGSDESGKGDFFGPLVVAAVVVDATTAAKLQAAGVKDCKLLTDKKSLELEEVIKENVVDYSVLELRPQFYNLRYEQLKEQGDNLTQLLSSGHINALTQVLEKHLECEGALIDQFTKSNVIVNTLKKRFPAMQFKQQVKAESDLAVAAASVLARAKFLRTMEELSLLAGEDALPKGGGEAATACAKRLAERLGKEALRNFVKLHFANYKKL